MRRPRSFQSWSFLGTTFFSCLLGCSDTGGQPMTPIQSPVSVPDAGLGAGSDAGAGATPSGLDSGTLSTGGGPDAASGAGLPDGAAPGIDAGPPVDASPPAADTGPSPDDGGTMSTDTDSGPGDAGPETEAEKCTGTPLSVGDHEYTIQSKNGIKYSYILSVPASVDASRRAPLLVHWHALSSDPEEARKVTSIDAKAEAAKALVVFPRSPDKSWDVGSCCTTTVGGTRRDEEVFARELIKDVLSKACVDEKRIYTNGFSNGGMISQMLACKMGDVFAAAAPLGSTLTIPKSECTPSRPIPIFMLNGTADPLVGYDSPASSGGLTVPEDIKFWADKNHCTGEPETFLMKGKVKCIRYTQCAEGAEVAHCAVDGMGHCVPGMKTESASNCLTKTAFGLIPIRLGMPNNDVDALQMDVDFLLRFTLP